MAHGARRARRRWGQRCVGRVIPMAVSVTILRPMPTPAERQALLFVAAVALVGSAVRVTASRRLARAVAGAERGATVRPDLATRALAAQIHAVDSARAHRAPSRRRPAAGSRRSPPEPRLADVPVPEPVSLIDVNSAPASELERLPRVGPALAMRIVAYREQHGPFASLESLRHVRGIGPSTARSVAPLVTFSGRHSPVQSEAPASPAPRRRTSPGRNL
jgi:competence protein ComEA